MGYVPYVNGIFPCLMVIDLLPGLMHIFVMDNCSRSRLQDALDASDHDMKSASLAAGQGETYIRDILERGSNPGAARLAKIVKVLGKTLDDIYSPDKLSHTVPLVGFVGSRAEVFVKTGRSSIDCVEAPRDATVSTVAVEVRGESMTGFAEDGWLLYYDEKEKDPTPDMVGKLCIVWLGEDGSKIFVKKLLYGSANGLWTLLSMNSPVTVETDISICCAARVMWIKPI